MAVTTLDAVAALIAIDLQKGIAAMPMAPYGSGEVIGRAAELARAFRERGLPVVLVNVTSGPPGRTDSGPRTMSGFPPDWTELVPELDQQPGDIAVSKRRIGAFIGTGLDEMLRARGVTQVFIVGIATSVGVESTARSASDYGYNVVLVVDAMADRSAEAHRHSVEAVFPRIAETATTEDVLNLFKETNAPRA